LRSLSFNPRPFGWNGRICAYAAKSNYIRVSIHAHSGPTETNPHSVSPSPGAVDTTRASHAESDLNNGAQTIPTRSPISRLPSAGAPASQ
jgi:hypothetical protein